MNCKPGDLAVVVRSYRGYEGRIVRCVRLVGIIDWVKVGSQPTWLVDPPFPVSDAPHLIADCQLRPINNPGADAQDESLSWLPVPSREKDLA